MRTIDVLYINDSNDGGQINATVPASAKLGLFTVGIYKQGTCLDLYDDFYFSFIYN